MPQHRRNVCKPVLAIGTNLLIGSRKIGKYYIEWIRLPPTHHFDYSNLVHRLHVIGKGNVDVVPLAVLAPDHKVLYGTRRCHECAAEFAQG